MFLGVKCNGNVCNGRSRSNLNKPPRVTMRIDVLIMTIPGFLPDVTVTNFFVHACILDKLASTAATLTEYVF